MGLLFLEYTWVYNHVNNAATQYQQKEGSPKYYRPVSCVVYTIQNEGRLTCSKFDFFKSF